MPEVASRGYTPRSHLCPGGFETGLGALRLAWRKGVWGRGCPSDAQDAELG